MQVLDGHAARPVCTNDSSAPTGSPEHRAWRQDRALRLRVPPHEAWRGCLGLALLLERPDDTEAYGGRALLRNEQVSWLALRDRPARHHNGHGGRAYVNSANSAVAELRHGMPVL